MGWGGTDRGGYAEQPQLKAIDYKTGEDPLEHPALRRQLRHPEHCRQRRSSTAAAGGIGAYNATTGEPLWNARIGDA